MCVSGIGLPPSPSPASGGLLFLSTLLNVFSFSPIFDVGFKYSYVLDDIDYFPFASPGGRSSGITFLLSAPACISKVSLRSSVSNGILMEI